MSLAFIADRHAIKVRTRQDIVFTVCSLPCCSSASTVDFVSEFNLGGMPSAKSLIAHHRRPAQTGMLRSTECVDTMLRALLANTPGLIHGSCYLSQCRLGGGVNVGWT
jgi:hypothetical protein